MCFYFIGIFLINYDEGFYCKQFVLSEFLMFYFYFINILRENYACYDNVKAKQEFL